MKADTNAARSFEWSPKVRGLKSLNQLFCRTYHTLAVQTPCPLPKAGPAILVCNHTSGLDPLLLQSTSHRVIVWMMAKEYYEIGALNWFFKAIKAIPVNRNGRDTSATRAALRALATGHVLGIFPEGRIATDGQMLPFQTGAAMMAIKTRVPVYPAYLDGTQRGLEMVDAFKTRTVGRLRFGTRLALPFSSANHENLQAATGLIRQAVDQLHSQANAAGSH